jgi:large subunit ribosomal protein L3
MSPGILGKKIGMTQVFRADGQVVPVTVLKAGPCVVTQRKTPATDGYDAIQVGFVEGKRKANKPEAGHLKKANVENVKFQREFKLAGNGDIRLATASWWKNFRAKRQSRCDSASAREVLAGVVKRHHFGGEAIARLDDHRAPVRSAHRAFRRACFPDMRRRSHGQ